MQGGEEEEESVYFDYDEEDWDKEAMAFVDEVLLRAPPGGGGGANVNSTMSNKDNGINGRGVLGTHGEPNGGITKGQQRYNGNAPNNNNDFTQPQSQYWQGQYQRQQQSAPANPPPSSSSFPTLNHYPSQYVPPRSPVAVAAAAAASAAAQMAEEGWQAERHDLLSRLSEREGQLTLLRGKMSRQDTELFELRKELSNATASTSQGGAGGFQGSRAGLRFRQGGGTQPPGSPLDRAKRLSGSFVEMSAQLERLRSEVEFKNIEIKELRGKVKSMQAAGKKEKVVAPVVVSQEDGRAEAERRRERRQDSERLHQVEGEKQELLQELERLQALVQATGEGGGGPLKNRFMTDKDPFAEGGPYPGTLFGYLYEECGEHLSSILSTVTELNTPLSLMNSGSPTGEAMFVSVMLDAVRRNIQTCRAQNNHHNRSGDGETSSPPRQTQIQIQATEAETMRTCLHVLGHLLHVLSCALTVSEVSASIVHKALDDGDGDNDDDNSNGAERLWCDLYEVTRGNELMLALPFAKFVSTIATTSAPDALARRAGSVLFGGAMTWLLTRNEGGDDEVRVEAATGLLVFMHNEEVVQWLSRPSELSMEGEVPPPPPGKVLLRAFAKCLVPARAHSVGALGGTQLGRRKNLRLPFLAVEGFTYLLQRQAFAVLAHTHLIEEEGGTQTTEEEFDGLVANLFALTIALVKHFSSTTTTTATTRTAQQAPRGWRRRNEEEDVHLLQLVLSTLRLIDGLITLGDGLVDVASPQLWQPALLCLADIINVFNQSLWTEEESSSSLSADTDRITRAELGRKGETAAMAARLARAAHPLAEALQRRIIAMIEQS